MSAENCLDCHELEQELKIALAVSNFPHIDLLDVVLRDVMRSAYQRGRQDATAGNLVYLDYVLREVVDKLLADCKHDFQLLDTRDDVR